MPKINPDVEAGVAKAILEACATLEGMGMFRHDVIAGVELAAKQLRERPVAQDN